MLRLDSNVEFNVSPEQAIDVLEERISAGEDLLRAEVLDEPMFRGWKRAIERWQFENDGIIDEIVSTKATPTAMPDVAFGAREPTFEERVEELKDELSDDINVLSRAVARLRLRTDRPYARGAPAGQPQPARQSAGKATGRAAPSPKRGSRETPAKQASDVGDGDARDQDSGSGVHEESPTPTSRTDASESASSEATRGVVKATPARAAPTDAPTSSPPGDDGPESGEQQTDELFEADEGRAPVPVVIAPEASAALPGYDADAVAHQDFIGVDAVVDAFSYLIAARSMDPPLAVGLFGRWGSGKTFLMRSIQRRVNSITRGARESGRPQGDIGVFKRVVQIEFNAWHYVEGNLWASLVEHIFANLRTSADEGGNELKHRRSEVTRSLASTREQRDTLDARLESLTRLQTEKEAELADLEERHRDHLRDVQQLRLGDVAAALTLTDKDKSVISDALAPVGVPELQDSAADAAQSLSDARDVLSRGQALLAPMAQYGWKWAALLVVAICIAPVIALGLEELNVSGVTQAVAAVAGVLSALAVLVRHSVSWTTSALNRVEVAEQRVRKRVHDAAADQADQIAVLQQQIESVQRDQRSVASERDEAAAQIRELTERLNQLTPGRLLAQFLEERSDSADYRKHLGLTAIVRRDFEQLSRLVASYNDDISRTSPQTTSEGSADFNRVVLYVDDLDRCPPRRVVEVLQAVHLLLSFPIFVVVVAVDPRWLSQSLQSEYRNLLGAASQPTQTQASAQDYLEKIFQIPFSLAPLDLDARIRFIDELLADEGDESHRTEVRSTPGVESPAQTPTTAQAKAGSRTVGAAGSDDRGTKAKPRRQGTQEATVETEPLHPPDAHPSEGASSNEPADTVDLAPSSLRLSAAEAEYFDVIMPVLDTSPRGLKRFVNIYRIIKSITQIDGQAIGGPGLPSAHQAAMSLLALQSGLPVLGAGLVSAVALADVPGSDPNLPLGTLIEKLLETPPSGGVDESARVLAWLKSNPEIADWRTAALSPTARHVRVYAFG